MKCRTNKVELRLILSGIFSILHMEMINDKCGAAHHLLNQRARAGLRANGRFLRFARKIQRFCQIHAAALPNMILIFRPTKNTCEQHAHEIK